MLLRGSFTGPLNSLILCNHTIKWVTHARLLGVTIDNKLTWPQRILKVKKSFVNKLSLLKRSSFLPRNILLRQSFPLYPMRCRYGEALLTSVVLFYHVIYCETYFKTHRLPNLFLRATFCKIPRIGVQDEKNRNPPNFFTSKPFGNYFRKYKTSVRLTLYFPK